MDKLTVENSDRLRDGRFRQLQSSLRDPKRALFFAGAIALLVLTVLWVSGRAATVSTSDARIATDIVAVSTDVSGRVVASHVSNGDRVQTGDLLYTIDDRQAQLKLQELEAGLASIRAQITREEAHLALADSKSETQIDARTADTQSARAAISAAQADLATAQREYDRAKGLFERGLISSARWDNAQSDLDVALQALRIARAEYASATAEVRSARVTSDEARLILEDINVLSAALEKAVAEVERQRVIVEQHQIRSPIDGIVDELFYDVGEHALQGFRVALLHDPEQIWVSANIKETEVRHVRIGAPVKIKVDSDPSAKVTGYVDLVRDLTVAEAALMPNPNAGGVFTKITQRIPVRVRIDETDTKLRPGTMVQISIAQDGPVRDIGAVQHARQDQ